MGGREQAMQKIKLERPYILVCTGAEAPFIPERQRRMSLTLVTDTPLCTEHELTNISTRVDIAVTKRYHSRSVAGESPAAPNISLPARQPVLDTST